MTLHSLTIQIDPEGLRTLADAGQLVALVKSETGPSCVVWQVVRPGATNLVSWAGSYQVYASTTALVWGATVQPAVTATAAGRHTYALARGGFVAGCAGLPVSRVGLHNLDDEIVVDGITALTGGVTEVAEVDGEPSAGPLDAQAVRFGEIAVTTLTDRVLVFPARGVRTGTLIDREWLTGGEVPPEVGIALGAPLAVDLTVTTVHTIQYDNATGGFAPGAATARVRHG